MAEWGDVGIDVSESVIVDAIWRIGHVGAIGAFVEILYVSIMNAIRAIPESTAPRRNSAFAGTTDIIDGVGKFRIGPSKHYKSVTGCIYEAGPIARS